MANPLANIKNTLAGSKKMLIFFGVVIVVVAGYLMTSKTAPVVSTSSVNTGQMKGADPIQGKTAITPAYEGALTTFDTDEVAKARETGKSAIPIVRPNTAVQQPVLIDQPPATPPVPTVPQPDPSITQQPLVLQQPIVNTVPIVAPPTQIKSAEDKARTDSMIKAMTVVGRPIPVAQVTTFGDPKDFDKTAAQQTAPSINDTTTSTTDPASKIKLPLSGKILYAEIVGKANSDNPGPVVAKILQGEYTGATLIGSFKTTKEAIVISFDKMTVEKTASGEEINETTRINAVAVDTKDIGTGLASSVDRHLFAKLTIGFATAFAQGFGDAVTNKGNTSYNTSNGTITSSNSDLSTTDELYSAGGKAIGKGGDVLQQEFGNQPTTIIVNGGTPIGVLFL